MDNIEFNLIKLTNFGRIIAVFMDWLGGDSVFIHDYIENKGELVPLVNIYYYEDNDPTKPLYRLNPEKSGGQEHYEEIYTDKVILSHLNSKLEKQLDEETKK